LKAVLKAGENEADAVKIERFLKKQHSKNFIEFLIDPMFQPCGILAQLIRVPSLRDDSEFLC
jgi:putative endonuclease